MSDVGDRHRGRRPTWPLASLVELVQECPPIMAKHYPVELTDDERTELAALLRAGTAAARILRHAARGPPGPAGMDERVAVAVSQSPVARGRRQKVDHGLAATRKRRPLPRDDQRTLAGKQEAHRIVLACRQPPAGQAR